MIYADKIELDNETHSDHFENIQSTNWQTVRFKPPPPGSPIGWRVGMLFFIFFIIFLYIIFMFVFINENAEFRPMEVQLSDFENAAFVTFAALLTRVVSDSSFIILCTIIILLYYCTIFQYCI